MNNHKLRFDRCVGKVAESASDHELRKISNPVTHPVGPGSDRKNNRDPFESRVGLQLKNRRGIIRLFVKRVGPEELIGSRHPKVDDLRVGDCDRLVRHLDRFRGRTLSQ